MSAAGGCANCSGCFTGNDADSLTSHYFSSLVYQCSYDLFGYANNVISSILIQNVFCECLCMQCLGYIIRFNCMFHIFSYFLFNLLKQCLVWKYHSRVASPVYLGGRGWKTAGGWKTEYFIAATNSRWPSWVFLFFYSSSVIVFL